MRHAGIVRAWWLAAVLAAVLGGSAKQVYAQLPVPVFGQHWDLCQEDLYGDVNSPSPEYGSAVTSIAMVLRYYGVLTDPGELHTWLMRSGVVPSDPGMWTAAASRGNALSLDRWDWQSAPADLNVINTALEAGYPVIAETRLPYDDTETQKHYVVLTGHSGGTYFMNDPWYGEATTFDQRYPDPARYIYGARIYRGTPSPLGGASPHGFLRGDATWWSDWETHWNGWDLALPRDAATRSPWEWYDLVGGADRSDRPSVGAIAVFQNAPNGGVSGAAGHVAYVIAVNGNRFRVRHSGLDNRWPSEAEFEFASADTVRRVVGKPVDPPIRLRGFLSQSGQPAGRQLLTAPPVAGARCQRRVLIVSAYTSLQAMLKKAPAEMPEMPSLACDISSKLPASLDDYRAIWFVDGASVQTGTGQALASYVQNGGGLVACGSAAAALASETFRASRPWMGVNGFSWDRMPGNGIAFPSPFLGVDLGADRRWMPLDQGQILLIAGYAGGTAMVTHPDYSYGYGTVCYTAQIGRGRFFYLPSCDNLDLQPALKKALFAGIRWVMLK